MFKTSLDLKFKKLNLKIFVFIAILIVVIGTSTTIFVASQTDKILRNSLISRAETMAAGIHDDVLKRLTGTPEDLSTDDYKDIKASMINIRKANNDSHFVYLMGVRDQKLFFYADSEAPESKDISLPGDFYADASEFKVKNAIVGVSFTEGPYKDVWGTWISGYAPIIDPESAELLAVAGIDIGVKFWREEIIYASSLPVTITLFLLVLLWLYYRSRKHEEKYIDKLKAIDAMKSEFVSVASHQLRTPLTGIKWFAELLLKGKTGDLSVDQKDFLSEIHNSNERMIKLVDNLLNVSRIETGTKFQILKVQADVVTIIDSLMNDLIGLAHTHDVTIVKSENFPKILNLSIDADKIRQVFQNLLSNAVKYSKAKGVVLVQFEKHEDKNEIQISVKDSGLGIPLNAQGRMFEKFFRADNVQTKETDGTGLGLYIAKAIVEGHGGKIWFESKENVGTTFFITLLNEFLQ